MTICAVLPNYNYAPYVLDALRAVLNQTYPISQVIVIDDASTDNSVEKIEEIIQGRAEVTFIRHKINQGFFKTAAEGVALAKTDFLIIAATDDCIAPHFCESHMRCFQKEPTLGLSCGMPTIFGKALPEFSASNTAFNTYLPQELAEILRKNPLWISGPTVMYRTAAFREFGGMRQEAQIFNDWILNYQIAFTYGIGYVHQPLGAVRVHSQAMSATCNRSEEKIFPAFDYIMQQLDQNPARKALFQRSGVLNDLGVPVQQYIRKKRACWPFFLPMQMRRARLKWQRMLIRLGLQTPSYTTNWIDV